MCPYNTTHLLRYHSNARGLGSSSDTRDGEELDEACEEASVRVQARLENHAVFLVKLCLDVIYVSCGL